MGIDIKMVSHRFFHTSTRIIVCLTAALIASCISSIPETPMATEVAPVPTLSTELKQEDHRGLSGGEIAALESVQKIDAYPLYKMEIHGGTYDQDLIKPAILPKQSAVDDLVQPTWACSLFALMNNGDQSLLGRNFDWKFSPALLLFTNPLDGYASVSMVDLAYLVEEDVIDKLDQVTTELKLELLDAHRLPFDGMNETGLAIGMAAVPRADPPFDPSLPTYDSLAIMRLILDRASSVQEALDLFGTVNIDWGSGPPLHYMIADRSGNSVLVEFVDGELIAIQSDEPYQAATNFSRAEHFSHRSGVCERYDTIVRTLETQADPFSSDHAHRLLANVAQPNTQWSVVYDLDGLSASVRMGTAGGEIYRFHITPEGRIYSDD